MKLKRLPEDFRVEELPLIQGGDRGQFTFYRLCETRDRALLEALDVRSEGDGTSRRVRVSTTEA